MANALMRKYLDILMEAVSFNSLQDAGDNYSPGNTQIWYWKEEFSHEMKLGFKSLQSAGKLPDLKNLSRTHVLIGTLAETDPEKIWNMMQAENWSPQNQAEAMIDRLGVDHTSMDVGDIIINRKQALMVDTVGFINLGSGEEV
jgi:hypothetical protein